MRRLLPLVSLLAVLAVPSAASAADPVPFGHACTAQDGVRFCPTTDIAHSVPSFDGTALDLDVTLPATGDGPFPTIVMLHGYGGSKKSFESATPDPVGPPATGYHYNTNYYAKQGYAVVTYSARGFGHSCGRSDPLMPTAYPGGAALTCEKGYSHLADQRYEVRDTQYLLGSLVDQGIAKADALAATGISYGGGQSLQLALLRDRVRNVDGTFSPWTSPSGTALRLAAAWPRWPWTDLARALVPNGRWTDFRGSNGGQSRTPIGVELKSYQDGLFAIRGTDAPVGDPTADLRTWKALVEKGEPYDAKAAAPLQELSAFHSGAGLLDIADTGFTAAPLLLEGGFTDELFPAQETIDAYRRLRKLSASANVALQLGDLGHSKGANKVDPDKYLNDQGAAFFAANLLGAKSGAPAIGSVTAYTQTCPKAKASKRYTATSWTALRRGVLRFGDRKKQTFTSTGGDSEDRRRPRSAAHDGRLHDLRRERVQERGRLRARAQARIHAARPADHPRHDQDHGQGRPDRRPPVGRRRDEADADDPRRLPPEGQPEGADRLPAPRQRLQGRQGPPRAPGAPGRGPAHLPGVQHEVLGGGVEAQHPAPDPREAEQEDGDR